MKLVLKLSTFTFFLTVFIACEKVPPIGERNLPAIDTVGLQNTDTTNNLGYQQKKVLIEEFTGVTCNNCPKAADEIKAIEGLYPGRVVAVGIHASNFAVPTSSYPDDFRTVAGKALYDFANPFGVPSGLIDRKDQGGGAFAKPFSNFGSEVQEILIKDTADISITTNAVVDETAGTISLDITFTNQKALSNNPDLFWVAYLTESKIIAPQKQPDNTKKSDYEHNHVLRSAANGAFGTNLNLGTSIDATTQVAGTLNLQAGWVISNSEVVVFVYDKNTFEVIQANGTKLK